MIVEAMQGEAEQGPQDAAQVREQTAQAAQREAVTADQLREQIRTEVRTQVQNDVRNALRGELRPDQVGALSAQIAEMAAQEAARAADIAAGRAPGITVRQDGNEPVMHISPDGIPDMPPRVQETVMSFFFTLAFIIVGFPIARAFARRMDRKAVATVPSGEMTHQLRQIQQSVEAVAIEVERISEAQRYTAKVLGEGSAQGVGARAGERLAAR